MFSIIIALFYLSSMLSHISHLFTYLNCLNPCIKHSDIFLNIRNLILCSEAGKKRLSCSGDYKYGVFLPIKL